MGGRLDGWTGKTKIGMLNFVSWDVGVLEVVGFINYAGCAFHALGHSGGFSRTILIFCLLCLKVSKHKILRFAPG